MHLDSMSGAACIDLDNWERRELFASFDSFGEPFHRVCLRVDCAEAFRYAKDHQLSV